MHVKVHKGGLQGPDIGEKAAGMDKYFRTNKGAKATEVFLMVDAQPLYDTDVVWEWMPSVVGETWENRSKERIEVITVILQPYAICTHLIE